MKKGLITALALAAGLAAPAYADPAATRYLVELTIRSPDGQVLSPSLIVDAGKSATFMKADKGYWFKMMARPHASGLVEVDVDSVFSSPEGMRHYGTNVELKAGAEPSVITSGQMHLTIRARPTR